MNTQPNTSARARAAGAFIVAAALAGALAACGGEDTDAGADSTPSASAAKPSHSASVKTACAVPAHPRSHGRVDRAAAGRLVTDTYGGHVLGVEKDTDRGKTAWEVEATGGDCGRIEVDVVVATGRIVTFEGED